MTPFTCCFSILWTVYFFPVQIVPLTPLFHIIRASFFADLFYLEKLFCKMKMCSYTVPCTLFWKIVARVGLYVATSVPYMAKRLIVPIVFLLCLSFCSLERSCFLFAESFNIFLIALDVLTVAVFLSPLFSMLPTSCGRFLADPPALRRAEG